MTTMAAFTHPPLVALFDVDGCLISTGGAGASAWRHAFERLHGVPADIGQFTEAGMTDPDVGRKTFIRVIGRDPTEQEMGRLLGTYLDRLAIEVDQSAGYRVMPGVEALLPRLVEHGLLLGIVSGAVEAAAHIKLGRARLNRFFSFGGYGSDSADRAELTRLAIARCRVLHGHALDPSRVLVIGDTPRDVEAGRAAGAVTVAVATGKYTVAQLTEIGADVVLPTLESPLPGIPI
jgi:phosphoglycolate phosphatase